MRRSSLWMRPPPSRTRTMRFEGAGSISPDLARRRDRGPHSTTDCLPVADADRDLSSLKDGADRRRRNPASNVLAARRPVRAKCGRKYNRLRCNWKVGDGGVRHRRKSTTQICACLSRVRRELIKGMHRRDVSADTSS